MYEDVQTNISIMVIKWSLIIQCQKCLSARITYHSMLQMPVSKDHLSFNATNACQQGSLIIQCHKCLSAKIAYHSMPKMPISKDHSKPQMTVNKDHCEFPLILPMIHHSFSHQARQRLLCTLHVAETTTKCDPGTWRAGTSKSNPGTWRAGTR